MCSYLGERFGGAMKYIWAIGLFAAGQSSTMTGTYTGQFVMSGFMELHVSPFKRALITRSVALFPTLAFAIAYAGTNQMDSLNQDLNVLQSFQLPFALIPVLYVSTREDIMGDFMTRSFYKWVVYCVCALLLALNIVTAVLATQQGMDSFWASVAIMCFLAAYFLFIVYLLVGPVHVQRFVEHRESGAVRALLGWLGRGSKQADAPYQAVSSAALGASLERSGNGVAAPLSPRRDRQSRPPDLDES